MIDQTCSHRILILAGLLGASGVAIGAFGAHGLESLLADREMDAETVTKRVGQFDVGARYHMYHAIAMLGLSAIPFGTSSRRMLIAGMLVAGTFFFSGSLYLLVLTNTPWLGAITPIGGLIWIIAWVLLPILINGSDPKNTLSPDVGSPNQNAS